jgi:CheY-like chemotaxis protein
MTCWAGSRSPRRRLPLVRWLGRWQGRDHDLGGERVPAAEAPGIAGDAGQPIDLLLTDVVMPEMLGNEVAKRVRAARPALPVLYMSGYAQPILDTHGAFAGQIDLLEKPFTEATLLTRVRRAIDNGTHPAT